MKGFTLLELLLTILLFTASFVALSETLTTGLLATGDNEGSLIATELAHEKMEEIKNKTYSAVTNETKAAVSGFSSFQREVVVTTPQTDLKQVSVTVYWFNKSDELSVGLATYVSNI